jgi:hypothetical protein
MGWILQFAAQRPPQDKSINEIDLEVATFNDIDSAKKKALKSLQKLRRKNPHHHINCIRLLFEVMFEN